ncbi:MAG: hypothetical protein IPG04_05470 [Polyangiaceae bacterium]|nr:hypothetical protein [Polyangiaceae bacterium]
MLGWLRARSEQEPATTENLETLASSPASACAHTLYKRDRPTTGIVRGGKIMIVDEFTGRILAGRRWSDGLHRAIEAKENIASRRRAAPSPPSPSRTCSACTKAVGDGRYGRHRAAEFHSALQARGHLRSDQQKTTSASTLRTSSTRPRRRSSPRSSKI